MYRYLPALSARARAFNEGSDARLAGLPRGDNPYTPGSEEAEAWADGWADVDRFWGLAAAWPVSCLPPVTTLEY